MDFNMKSGVLGLTVIAVVIGAAILLTVTLDVTENEYERTEYSYITDTTSLFDSDKSPQYLDYDMAISYVNYYTDDSNPYLGGVILTSTAGQYIYDNMEADINSTGTVNLYKLKLPNQIDYESEDGDLDSTDFGTDPTTPPGSNRFVFADYGSSGNKLSDGYYSYYFYDSNKIENLGASLSDPLDGQFLQSTYIYHNNDGTYTGALTHIWTSIGESNLGSKITIEGGTSKSSRFFIGSTDDYVYNEDIYVYAVAYCEKNYYDILQSAPTYRSYDKTAGMFVSHNAQIAAHSCLIDMATRTVSLYSEYEITSSSVPVRVIDLDNAMIIYGFDSYADSDYTMGYEVPIHYKAYTEVYAYLDASQGVRVSKAVIDYGPFDVTIETNGGRVTGTTEFTDIAYGTQITLSSQGRFLQIGTEYVIAIPITGYTFVNWLYEDGTAVSSGDTVTSDMVITANFTTS